MLTEDVIFQAIFVKDVGGYICPAHRQRPQWATPMTKCQSCGGSTAWKIEEEDRTSDAEPSEGSDETRTPKDTSEGASSKHWCTSRRCCASRWPRTPR